MTRGWPVRFWWSEVSVLASSWRHILEKRHISRAHRGNFFKSDTHFQHDWCSLVVRGQSSGLIEFICPLVAKKSSCKMFSKHSSFTVNCCVMPSLPPCHNWSNISSWMFNVKLSDTRNWHCPRKHFPVCSQLRWWTAASSSTWGTRTTTTVGVAWWSAALTVGWPCL